MREADEAARDDRTEDRELEPAPRLARFEDPRFAELSSQTAQL
jgi:hypothetical protein